MRVCTIDDVGVRPRLRAASMCLCDHLLMTKSIFFASGACGPCVTDMLKSLNMGALPGVTLQQRSGGGGGGGFKGGNGGGPGGPRREGGGNRN